MSKKLTVLVKNHFFGYFYPFFHHVMVGIKAASHKYKYRDREGTILIPLQDLKTLDLIECLNFELNREPARKVQVFWGESPFPQDLYLLSPN